ncbi:MAG: flagellar basal body P-ring protein FlgI [Nitrospiraceae bacterium]|nr:flagellar basal body P-ring protein FlgI [Nitrospiraceae bacterium]
MAYLLVLCLPGVSLADRIKDIASFEGVRENQLIGYGVVVGLNGSGDKGLATMEIVTNMLRRMGISVNPNDIKSKNTASVMVTATLPPFPKSGMKVDVLVSAMGDATSLQGGTLLLTQLNGPDGKVYAIAQGPVSIGGFVGGGGGTQVQKNHPTAGKVPEGAIIEENLPFTLGSNGRIRLFLDNPDFTTAESVTQKINSAFDTAVAKAVDPSTISLRMPEGFKGGMIEFLTRVEDLDVPVDSPARVVINERTGTVIIGENVKLAPVAIAHGGLTIEIKTNYNVSQPQPFAPGGQTVVTPQQNVNVTEKKASLMEASGATLGDIVRALNALGVTPRDLISIMQALKASGALHADLEII